MRWLHRFRVVLVGLFRRRVLDDQLHRDIAFHLEQETAERMRAGLPAPEAWRRARASFGSVDAVREDIRARRRLPIVEQCAQDVRYGVRGLTRNPAFALTALITLALGIGVTTAVSGVVNSVLIRPLPYKDGHRLVRIVEHSAPVQGREAPEDRIELSEQWFLEWRARAKTLSAMGMHQPWLFATVASGEQRIRGAGARVTPSILSMLGVRPTIGRAFQPEDEHDNVVILSTGTWRQLFGEDPHAIGRVVTVGGRSHTVVGVMPSTFGFPTSATAFWVQYRFGETPKERRSSSSSVLAQLADGISTEAATTEARVIAYALRTSDTAAVSGGRQTADSTFEVVHLKDELVAPARQPLRLLMGAAVIVIVIVCANVANLLLVRGAARKREMAVRLALGATRARIVRQLLVESLVLGGAGGLAGIALAVVGVRLVRMLAAVTTPELFHVTDRMAYGGSTLMPRFDELAIDPAVLAFAMAASLVTSIVCSVVPALQLSLVQGGAPGVSVATPAAASARVTERHRRLSNPLVVGQLTLPPPS
jgi:predicted permease